MVFSAQNVLAEFEQPHLDTEGVQGIVHKLGGRIDVASQQSRVQSILSMLRRRGVLRVAMPAEDVPLLNLRVNFLGVVDFDKRELSFDASLYDSRLMTFTLTGDMAVRLYWGENANFLLTAGGHEDDFAI